MPRINPPSSIPDSDVDAIEIEFGRRPSGVAAYRVRMFVTTGTTETTEATGWRPFTSLATGGTPILTTAERTELARILRKIQDRVRADESLTP